MVLASAPSPMPRAAVLLLLVAGLSSAVACRPDPPLDEPDLAARDVLLITIDTLRFDATGFSGADLVETPVMDGVAAGGWVSDNAHAHAVMTLPSHASILTGLYPHQHGIRDNAGFRLDPALPTLATLLGEHGYRTAAFVSAFPLDRRFGLDTGFDHYDDAYEGYGTGAFTFPERPGDETVSRAVAWWAANENSPRFMWVHLFTPHFPYQPAESLAKRYADRPYYGEAATADAHLGPLLAPLVRADDGGTIVVITSDHGESLGEHGEATHGLFAYEATLKIPLVFWAPGLVPATRDAELARHVDIVPTLLDLLALDAPAGLPGRAIFAPSADPRGVESYFEALGAHLNRGWAPLYGTIVAGRKAIDLPLRELYDLESDPGERVNLADRRPDELDRLLRRIPAGAQSAIDREALDDEELARLRSLGYVASNVGGSPGAADVELDPKRLIHIDRKLQNALTLYNRGRWERAVAELLEILEEQPGMAVAYGHLSFIYGDLGRVREAAEVLVRARATGVDNEVIRRKLALHLVRLGDADAADRVLSIDARSVDPETQLALGRIAAATGRSDEARARFRRATELDPTLPEARIDEGVLLLTEGRLDEAESALTEGLAAQPHAEGWNAMGVLRSRRGDAPGAIDAWRKALEIDPRLADALFNLALSMGRSGRPDEAARLLERYVGLVDGAERERARAMLRQLEAVSPGPR